MRFTIGLSLKKHEGCKYGFQISNLVERACFMRKPCAPHEQNNQWNGAIQCLL